MGVATGWTTFTSDTVLQYLLYFLFFLICYVFTRSLRTMATAAGGDSQYDIMKDCHEKAYSLISDALDIDESGLGGKERAIDYYSMGVVHLEKGIHISIAPNDPNLEKAERLRKKMINNLEMAKDRVQSLCEGKDLKGEGKDLKGTSSTSVHSDRGGIVLQPSKSIKVPTASALPKKKHHAKGSGVVSNSKTHHVPRGTVPKRLSNSSTSNEAMKKVKTIEVKGVDQALVQMIMNEIQEKDTAVSWDSIVGLDNAKRTLQEIVVFPALNPELFVGLRTPAKGLLLFGPPGNGKTMLAKAVAQESKSTFFNISASSLTSKYVGEGEKLVKALFAVARECQPSIIFIDEVDSLLSRRGDGEHDAMRRMKNEFLLQFDGVGSSEGDRFLVMAATNRPDEIDDAALRRFTKRIYVPLPDFGARMAALEKLISKHQHDLQETSLMNIASETSNYSFSDLTALAKDAALGPIRELNMESLKSMKPHQIRPILYEDFSHSLTQIRPSVTMDAIKKLEDWNKLYGIGL